MELPRVDLIDKNPLRPTENFALKIMRMHWFLFFLMISLSTAGVFFIRSATYMTTRADLANAANNQMVWIFVGLVLYFVLSLMNYRILVDYALWLLGLAIVLLIYAHLFAPLINNSKSWIRLGGIGIQPAELAKLAYICSLATLLTHFRDQIKQFKPVLLAAILAFVPFALIFKLPDLGSSMVFGPITFLVLFAAGVRKRYLLLPILLIVGVMALCYIRVYQQDKGIPFLKEYQNDRIRVFFNPERDKLKSGWNIRQSLIAVGSGGLTGKGYMKGDQNIYGFLPKNVSYNDFIFAVIGEEFGFIGGAAIIIGIGLVILCAVQIAMSASDYPGVLIATGIVGMLITHYFVNIGMTIKVTPITGIPLPFISYGGTFMAICMAAMGILQSIWIRRHDRPF